MVNVSNVFFIASEHLIAFDFSSDKAICLHQVVSALHNMSEPVHPRPRRRQGTPWWETVHLPICLRAIWAVSGVCKPLHPGGLELHPGCVLWVLVLCMTPTSRSYWEARDVGPEPDGISGFMSCLCHWAYSAWVSIGFLIFKIGIESHALPTSCGYCESLNVSLLLAQSPEIPDTEAVSDQL